MSLEYQKECVEIKISGVKMDLKVLLPRMRATVELMMEYDDPTVWEEKLLGELNRVLKCNAELKGLKCVLHAIDEALKNPSQKNES